MMSPENHGKRSLAPSTPKTPFPRLKRPLIKTKILGLISLTRSSLFCIFNPLTSRFQSNYQSIQSIYRGEYRRNSLLGGGEND